MKAVVRRLRALEESLAPTRNEQGLSLADVLRERRCRRVANLGHVVSDQTVGNILRRHGLAPAPKRSQNTNWKDFIASHMAVLAGVDFFTVEVLTWQGLATYYVLFFLHLETRRVSLAGITRHPTETWMEQMGRNAIDEASGYLRQQHFPQQSNGSTRIAAPSRGTGRRPRFER